MKFGREMKTLLNVRMLHYIIGCMAVLYCMAGHWSERISDPNVGSHPEPSQLNGTDWSE